MAASSCSETSTPMHFGRYDYDYEGQPRYCFCGLKAPRIMSWSEKNPGQRFFGCPIYDPEKKERQCKFFIWYDRDYPFRAKEVIYWLYNTKTELENDLEDARERIRALRDVVKRHQEKEEQQVEALEKKLNELQILVTVTMAYAAKLEKWKKCGQISFVVVVFFFILHACILLK